MTEERRKGESVPLEARDARVAAIEEHVTGDCIGSFGHSREGDPRQNESNGKSAHGGASS